MKDTLTFPNISWRGKSLTNWAVKHLRGDIILLKAEQQILRQARLDWSFSGLFIPPPSPALPSVFPPNDRPVAAKSWLKFLNRSDCVSLSSPFWFLPAPCLCVRRWSSLPGSGTSGGKHYSRGRGSAPQTPANVSITHISEEQQIVL